MKISIWQQFSSNNSTSYTVVGVFESVKAAQDAAETLRGLQSRIKDWFEKHPEATDSWSEGWPYPVSAVEKEIGQEFGFEWKEGGDWPFYVKIDYLDQMVIVEPESFRPDLGPTAMDLLIPRLGGAFFVDGNQYGDSIGKVRLEITCKAPKEKVVTELIRDESMPEVSEVHHNELDLKIIIHDLTEYSAFPKIIEKLRKLGCADLDLRFEQSELDFPFEEDDL